MIWLSDFFRSYVHRFFYHSLIDGIYFFQFDWWICFHSFIDWLLFSQFYWRIWLFLVKKPLKKSQIEFSVQKAAQYSETNEKSIFRFLVFEIWSIEILRIVWNFFSFQKMRNILKQISSSWFCFDYVSLLGIWSIWYLTVVKSELGTWDFCEPDSETLTSETREPIG